MKINNQIYKFSPPLHKTLKALLFPILKVRNYYLSTIPRKHIIATLREKNDLLRNSNKELLIKNKMLLDKNSLLKKKCKQLIESKMLYYKKFRDVKVYSKSIYNQKKHALDLLKLKRELCIKLQNRSIIPYIGNVLHFAQDCSEIASEIKADVYLSHDDGPLLAARMLSDEHGGNIFYDAIEVPEYKSRTGSAYREWPIVALYFTDLIRESIIPQIHGVMTVSHPLVDLLKKDFQNVVCIENFRYYQQTKIANNNIRKDCNITNNEKLILFMNHITPNYYFKEVLEALTHLSEDFHLATLGNFSPPSYLDEIEYYVEKLNLKKRVHLFKPVPYDDLAGYASGADVGLILRDISVLNNYISLPNRLFDYIAARIPICSSPIPHIAKIIRQYDIGEIINHPDPKEISKTIQNLISDINTKSMSLEIAAKKMTWNTKEKQLLDFLNHPKVVTILGIKDLTKNNRSLRIAKTLADVGTKVNIVTTKPFKNENYKNIFWYNVFSS